MSRSTHIFLATDLAPRAAADRLAEALGTHATDRDGDVYVAVQLGDAQVGGEVAVNTYGAPPDPEPDEISVLDGYPVAYEIRRVPADEEATLAAARQVFDTLVERLKWPVLLVDNLAVLVAAWNPAEGRTDFPSGTSADADDEAEWSRYAIDAH
ncbi:hypothetical protein [Actinoplanes sp. NPDC026619]|uniref:hypothetical protein n=1 Tax=Actinoplanes sp. NPDC026619 TaxID=3155798 RepID=UPI0033F0F795